MKIENVRVYGFEPAMRDMRNPKESWADSDSRFYDSSSIFKVPGLDEDGLAVEQPLLGPKDLDLACRLVKAGGSHRKFMREIVVWWTITIPRYLWQELDTYKVSTVRNSCSTMHKLGFRDLTPADFQDGIVLPQTLDRLNDLGLAYRMKAPAHDTTLGVLHGVELLRYMKAILPEGFLQKAGYVFNYEVALRVFHDRHNHRMQEWSGVNGICHVIANLPYMAQFLEAAGENPRKWDGAV